MEYISLNNIKEVHMKNNKVLMSLVVASISAMAAAPFVLESETNANENKKDSNENMGNSNIAISDLDSNIKTTQENISIEAILAATMMTGEENVKIQKDLTEQTAAMLNKKDTLQPLYESISIIAENYGITNNQIMKKEVYDQFDFGYTDSTASGGEGSKTYIAPYNPSYACHWACHTACHSACHGSRGWR